MCLTIDANDHQNCEKCVIVNCHMIDYMNSYIVVVSVIVIIVRVILIVIVIVLLR